MQSSLERRLENETRHAKVILDSAERNWGWHTPAGQIRWQKRLDLLSAEASDLEILEVGCGTGTFTAGLAKRYSRLTAIDISSDLLVQARAKAPSVTFVQADAHRTAFPDEYFDCVIGCSVLHHLDWDLALQEMYRILKPTGRILFSEPNLSNPQIFLQKKWGWLKKRMGDSPDESAFTAAQARRSLAKAGFTEVCVQPFEFLHPSTPVPLIPMVLKVEKALERTLLSGIAGSLRIAAVKGGRHG